MPLREVVRAIIDDAQLAAMRSFQFGRDVPPTGTRPCTAHTRNRRNAREYRCELIHLLRWRFGSATLRALRIPEILSARLLRRIT